MTLARQTRFLLLVALATWVGVALLWHRREPLVAEASTEEPLTQSAMVVVAPVVTTVVADVDEREGAQISLVSASIRQVLPQLAEAVSDWRAYQPQKLMIAPHGDLALEFEKVSVSYEDGRTVWRGRNALTGALLVTVATQGDWHALLEIPTASSFEFHISGQRAPVS